MIRPSNVAKTLGRILFFPLAALALGTACQFLLPDGLWRADSTAMADDGVSDRAVWKDAAPKVASGAWLLVDAREKAGFEARHLDGAISLPAGASTEDLRRFAEEKGVYKTVVIYGSNLEDAEKLAGRLRDEAKMTDARVLEGAWEEAP